MSVGVIIGRFQVHSLHEGQKIIFNDVLTKHKKIIVFLGVSHCGPTRRNPLDFITRKRMIESYNSDLIVLPLSDMKSDLMWSKQIDSKIHEVFPNENEIFIYGGRDSFIPYYKGKYNVIEMSQFSYNSGTEVRQKIADGDYINNEDFRAGCIYTTFQQYVNPKPTIDVAIINDKHEILLGRKQNEDKFRFIGGFVDVNDGSLERTVRRETMEETSVEIGDIRYVTSYIVDDWRYKNEKEKIMTILFKAKFIYGHPKPGDDIHELRWFDLNNLKIDVFVKEHQPLFENLKECLI